MYVREHCLKIPEALIRHSLLFSLTSLVKAQPYAIVTQQDHTKTQNKKRINSSMSDRSKIKLKN